MERITGAYHSVDNLILRRQKLFCGKLAHIFILQILLLLSPDWTFGQECTSEPVEAGILDFNFQSVDVTSAPTEAKPESKVWYNDGFWWGVLWSPDSLAFRIHRLDFANQCWLNVGPNVDTRPRSGADALSEGSTLYVSTRTKTNTKSVHGPQNARLNKYLYNSATKSYSLETGFPVDISTRKTEALTITKDTTGQLWAVWNQDKTVLINRSLGDDATWGEPFQLPVQQSSTLSDDIAAVTAMPGGKIGIMWSHQPDEKMYFSVHDDSDSDTNWGAREDAAADSVLGGLSDDHINFAISPNDNSLLAVTKTSLVGDDAPRILLLRRSSAGVWERHVVGTGLNRHTRPIVLINTDTDSVYVVATGHTTVSPAPTAIFLKRSYLFNLSFDSGFGEPIIESDSQDEVNDATSAKHAVTNESGILVLASDSNKKRYLHTFIPLSGTMNTSPVAANDATTVPEDGTVEVSVVSNDTDPNGSIDPSSVVIVTEPSHGSALVNSGANTVTYSPEANFNGQDVFTYTVRDNQGQTSNEGIVTITVTSVNDAPAASDDSTGTDNASSVVVQVTDNDSDIDGSLDPASIVITNGPAGGTATSTPAGTIVYTPHSTFWGFDSLFYKIADDEGSFSNEALLRVRVNAIPVAMDDTSATNQGTAVTINVTANDFDPDGTIDINSVVIVTQPLNGSVAVGPEAGSLTYTPDPGFVGADSVLYILADNEGTFSSPATLQIGTNLPPVAVNDMVVTARNEALEIDVFANDFDPDDGNLDRSSLTVIFGPFNGAATIHPVTGLVNYVPANGFSGTDIFRYNMLDDVGMQSNNATVNVLVTFRPVASNDLAETTSGIPVEVDVLANDTDADGTLDSASVAISAFPSNGALVVNSSSGHVTYTSSSGFFGEDQFAYTVRDNNGVLSNEALVDISVLAPNTAPTAFNDSVNILMDEPVNIDVLSNDVDPEGGLDPATVSIVLGSLHGTSSVDAATGVIIYTPDAQFAGSDSIEYTANDIEGAVSNVARVIIRVNEPPLAQNDEVVTNEDTPIDIAILANDFDPDGLLIPASIVFQNGPSHGTILFDDSTGVLRYTPNQNFFGADSVGYVIDDDSGVTSAPALVRVTIAAVNDAPIVVSDTLTTPEDVPVSFPVSANDFDVDGSIDAASVAIVDAPLRGTAVVNGSAGEVLYAPALNFTGADSFSYSVADVQGLRSDKGWVFITVTDVNDPPVARNDTLVTSEELPLVANILGNDSDPDGSLNPASLEIVLAPANGASFVNSASGTVTYQPNPNFAGLDSLKYTVKDDQGLLSNAATAIITVNSVNDPPIALNDSVTTPKDTNVLISVLSNDLDIDGQLDPSSLVVVSVPANGQATPNAGGSVLYEPFSGFVGEDAFTYSVRDNEGALANNAEVKVAVVAVNQPPVVADDDAFAIAGNSTEVAILANDFDAEGSIDTASILISSPPTHGTATISLLTGVVTYLAEVGFSGADSFRYTVADDQAARSSEATVSISVNLPNQAPLAVDDSASTLGSISVEIAVLSNDSDSDGTLDVSGVAISTAPSHGTTSVAPTGRVTYTPESGFAGVDSFQYRVPDNEGLFSEAATVTINVFAANVAPVAVSDTTSTLESVSVEIAVLSNDSDSDGTLDVSGVAISTAPSHGTTSVAPTGRVTYTPESGFAGVDSFQYRVPDNEGLFSEAATVTINVFAANVAPVAVSDTTSTLESVSVEIAVLSNDSDSDGTLDVSGVAISTAPSHGTTSVAPTGRVTYTPESGFAGVDSFQYRVPDNEGLFSEAATVTINVFAANVAPVAVSDSASTVGSAPVAIVVLSNDSDSDGSLAAESVAISPAPSNGSVSVSSGGVVSYTAASGFTGVDSFGYTVDDNEGLRSNVATVTVTVSAVNTAPVANNDSASVVAGGSVELAVLSNDSDADGGLDSGSLEIVSLPAHGTVVVGGSGLVTYSAFAGFSGSDSFSYRVSDIEGLVSNSAEVFITITAGGGAVVATFVATDDGQVKVTEPGSNYGSKETSKVESGKFLSFYKFAVSGLSGIVTRATLRLHVTDGSTDGGDDGGSVFSVSNNLVGTGTEWTESVLTSGNAPLISGGALSSAGPVLPNETVEFDVTAAVNGNGTYSFGLQSGSGNQVKYFTREGLHAPELEIESGGGSGGGNVAPVASDDAASTQQDISVVLNILANDSDSDGALDVGSVEVVSFATSGSVLVNPNSGLVTYTPGFGFNGTDSFSYRVLDDEGLASNVALVSITVTGQGGGGEVTTLIFQPTDDGQVKLTDPGSNYGSKETAKIELDKFVSYYKFSVAGLGGAVTRATLKLAVATDPSDGGDNGGSVFAVSNSFSGTSVPWTEALLTSGNAPAITGGALASAGAVGAGQTVEFDLTGTVQGDGVFSFALRTPSSNQVKYFTREGTNPPELLLEVSGSGGTNVAPVAVLDSASTVGSAPVAIVVLSNDSDSDGSLAAESVAISPAPSNGSVSVSSGGVVSYTAASGFTGVDSFGYTVDDNEGLRSNVATVTVTVSAVNTAPVANNDSASVVAGGSVELAVLSNDSDADGGLDSGSLEIVSLPAHGTVVVGGSGLVTYSAFAGFSGSDSFSYRVSDIEGLVSNSAEVFITITAGGGAVVATFVATDDGQVKVTEPGSNYGSKETSKVESGKFLSFYKFAVSGLSGIVTRATLRLHVTDGSTDGGDDGGSVFSVSNNLVGTGTEWTESVLTSGNAPLISGGALSSAGPVLPNETVEFDVTAAVNGNGTYSFGLQSGSGNQVKYFTREGLHAPELEIESGGGSGGGNVAPVASDDAASTQQDISVVLNILANDSDSDGALDVGSVEVVSFATSGSVLVNPNSGLVTYTPGFGFNGTDSFSYRVLDDEGLASNVALVSITVTGQGGGGEVTTLIFQPTDDGQVKLTDPGSNYGSKETAKIELDKFVSYYKFSVAGLGGAVTRATLKLAVATDPSDGGDNGGSVFAVSNSFSGTSVPWTEALLTSGNAPAITGGALASAGAVGAGQTVEFDLTGTVQGDGVFSFALRTPSSNQVKYFTREGISPPELAIEFTASSAAANIVQVAQPIADLKTEMTSEGEQVPEQVFLAPNYPNPFNIETAIRFGIPQAAKVDLRIYNIRGQEVKKLLSGFQQPGVKSLRWNGTDNMNKVVASGFYFLRLHIGDTVLARSLLLQK